jgi:hypothetical protein
MYLYRLRSPELRMILTGKMCLFCIHIVIHGALPKPAPRHHMMVITICTHWPRTQYIITVNASLPIKGRTTRGQGSTEWLTSAWIAIHLNHYPVSCDWASDEIIAWVLNCSPSKFHCFQTINILSSFGHERSISMNKLSKIEIKVRPSSTSYVQAFKL